MLLPSLDSIALDQPLLALPLVFLGGVLTSLTPCIYPMIPITIALVGGETVGSAPVQRGRALRLTLAYVTGLALVYALLGLLAGLTGTLFGTVSSNPWLYFLQANVLLIAGLFLLDVFTFRLPASTMEWAARVGGGGRLGGERHRQQRRENERAPPDELRHQESSFGAHGVSSAKAVATRRNSPAVRPSPRPPAARSRYS